MLRGLNYNSLNQAAEDSSYSRTGKSSNEKCSIFQTKRNNSDYISFENVSDWFQLTEKSSKQPDSIGKQAKWKLDTSFHSLVKLFKKDMEKKFSSENTTAIEGIT